MGAPIVEDELWALIEPLLPTPKPRRKKYPGRLPVANRAALNGILFVLKTGIRWRDVSTKLGFGSGSTCWRRLRDWQKAGVWKRLHELLLAKLREAGELDVSRAAVDSSSVRAVWGGRKSLDRTHGSRATKRGGTEFEKCFVNVGAMFEANTKTTKVVKPRMSMFDNPSEFAQNLPRPLPCSVLRLAIAGLMPPLAKLLTMRLGVIATGSKHHILVDANGVPVSAILTGANRND